jgi:hypothetical protein
MKPSIDVVEQLMTRFPHIPGEAILKEDLLRAGIAFEDSALTNNAEGEIKPKSYFIFSFDHKKLSELGAAAKRRPPEEIALTGGPFGLRRTIVSVRTNPGSPYRVVRAEDGTLTLDLDGQMIAMVEPPPMPDYYRHALSNGKSVMETAPTIQWGYLIYLTVLRLCQYFGAKEECQYCDINHNWRQHKQEGRPYTGVKGTEDVLEALAIIDRYDTKRVSQAYTLTGGSITSKVDGLAEADFYGRYAQAIEARFPGRWIGKVVAQALPKVEVQRYRDYGIKIYHPNYEVWDKELFTLLCPGKERYTPRFTTWCPEPTTPLGIDNPEGAPLEYHVRLLETYSECLQKHGLKPPPGYGVPGAGRAVFSVSAFMDTLPPEADVAQLATTDGERRYA